MSEDLIKSGDLAGALEAARNAVRKDASDPRARIFLFQVESVLGHWEKARDQLDVIGSLNPDGSLLAQIFGPVLECEAVRSDIFAGRRTPIVLGEPEDWTAWLVEACRLVAEGDFKAAEDLRTRAFEAAPASAGEIDGRPFEWIADADTRLGPVLEVIMDGCYRWVPMFRIASIQLEAPHDLRDLIWAPARFVWTNGGYATGFIPTRYPGSETSETPEIRLSRRTEWIEKPGGTYLGVGQRQLATPESEYPLLEIRQIAFADESESPIADV